MNATKRAFLYLVRKRSKSSLLFAVLVLLITLMICSTAIGNAAGTAVDNLRYSLGGYFKLVNNPSYPGKAEAITESLIDCITENEGIRTCNKMNIAYLLLPEITLQAGRFSAEGDPKSQLARFLGNSDTSLHEYFLLHSFDLVEGRHITENDVGKAIISQYLADMNGISIGDYVCAELFQDDIRNDLHASTHRWEVVGFFTPNSGAEKDNIAECDMVNNFIFADITSLIAVQAEINEQNEGKYRGATFFVKDPAQIDVIIDETFNLQGVDWDAYELSKNNKAYQDAVSPMKRLESYTKLFLIMIIVLSAVLLSLIMLMWIRDRMHEIGVLISLGVLKKNIIGQHIIELLIVLLLAMAVAIPLSEGIAASVGNGFLQNITQDQIETGTVKHNIFYEPIDLTQVQKTETIEISISMQDVLFAFACGVSVEMISVGVSSIAIMRLKPKDILSSIS